MNILADELQQLFPEVSALQFYRNIFPAGELDELDFWEAAMILPLVQFTQEKVIQRSPIRVVLCG